MSSSARSVLLLWLLMLPLVINGKTHVTVRNRLDGKLDLTLHCKSEDDDLGAQLLHYDQTYEFSFNPRFLGITLFYCTFRWQGACHWFDIYRQDRDICTHCNWNVTQAEPCRILGGGGADRVCYNWNQDPCVWSLYNICCAQWAQNILENNENYL